MNKRRHMNSDYKKRDVKDLKDMVTSSGKLYKTKTAFLVKNKPEEEYKPITYKRFAYDVDALGTSFLKMGLSGKKIAVIGDNSYEWAVTYFATVNGASVIVPIDKDLTVKEITNILNKAQVDAIVYSGKMKETIFKVGLEIKTIKHFINKSLKENTKEEKSWINLVNAGKIDLNVGNTSFSEIVIDPEKMCTILFTSGTMGNAKGVMLSHKNIISNVYNLSKYVNVEKNYTSLSVLPMHHTYEMTAHICTALYQGVGIAICDGLKYIQPNLQEAKVNIMLGVPLIFEGMHKKIMKKAETTGKLKKMETIINLSRKLKLFNYKFLMKKIFKPIHELTGNNVELFVSGGAAINPKVIEDFEAMGFPMIQGYGMTENAPIIAVNRDRYSKASSVGPPLEGTRVKIIDEGNMSEEGVGEIICKGDSVMLGYYDEPEETAKTIRDGWLYTGDYGHLDEDGYLYVLGRKKNVIVTKNGKNIFPEEIEFKLTESLFIQEALVYGEEEKRTGDTLVKADIYPSYDTFKELNIGTSEEKIRETIEKVIDEINEEMSTYKRIKRFGIRKEDFEKTTTKKIKRAVEEEKRKREKEEENVKSREL